MKPRAGAVVSLLCFLHVWSIADAICGDGTVTVTARASLTTSSQLFTNPDAPDPIERSAFIPLENQFGGGVEIKYTFPESNLALGLSADYIEAGTTGRTTGSVPFEDGYRVVPVELTAFFVIPISGPSFKIFMGGGGGAYVGERIYTLGGVTAPSVDAKTGFGIHILGGASYRISDLISISGEMKFRDLQFNAANAFQDEHIVYNGRVIEVGTEPFYSTIQTDGVIFHLGLSFSF